MWSLGDGNAIPARPDKKHSVKVKLEQGAKLPRVGLTFIKGEHHGAPNCSNCTNALRVTGFR
jgi:hypothetical protein